MSRKLATRRPQSHSLVGLASAVLERERLRAAAGSQFEIKL